MGSPSIILGPNISGAYALILRVELRDLEMFVLLAGRRQLTKVAGTLRISQPRVTQMLQDLEEELQTTLVERGPRGRAGSKLRLTEAGEVFRMHAQQALHHAGNARRSAEALERRSGDVRIGFTPGNRHLLAAEVGAFLRRRAKVNFLLEERQSRHDIELHISTNRLHLGLVDGPPLLDGLKYECMFTSTLRLILSPGHPILTRKTLSKREWARLRVVSPSRQSEQGQPFWDLVGALRANGIVIRTEIETNNPDIALGLVRANPELVAIFPVPEWQTELPGLTLANVPGVMRVTNCLVWNGSGAGYVAASQVVTALLEHFKSRSSKGFATPAATP